MSVFSALVGAFCVSVFSALVGAFCVSVFSALVADFCVSVFSALVGAFCVSVFSALVGAFCVRVFSALVGAFCVRVFSALVGDCLGWLLVPPPQPAEHSHLLQKNQLQTPLKDGLSKVVHNCVMYPYYLRQKQRFCTKISILATAQTYDVTSASKLP